MFTQYIYSNQTVIRCASYIKCVLKKKHIYVGKWVLSTWGIKKKAIVHVLEDVTSFLSNSTGPSNSTQQWRLKSLEEKLVKDEIIGYNEGYMGHIPKELAIFPNSHTKYNQGATIAHNCHLGRFPKIGHPMLDTPTTLRGGVNECGVLFPKTSLLHKNSSISIQHLFITHFCHL
jgi:hypothetical protein